MLRGFARRGAKAQSSQERYTLCEIYAVTNFFDTYYEKNRRSFASTNPFVYHCSMKESELPKPTEAELEILQVLWQHGPATVRAVHDQLPQTRDTGYTTTLKNMQNMVQKGLLLRDETQRSHVYTAALGQEEAQKELLDKFLETTFGGSAMQLVMQALGNRQTTPEELNQIKALINKLEGGPS